jgi:ribosomal protein S18 acetylase RimI-like enzyme
MAISVRNIKADEMNEVVRVEREAWPEEIRAPRNKFKSRMETFPKGFLGIYVDGELAGVSTSQLIKYPNEKLTSWEEITDNGFITNSHCRGGNALYVVSLGISGKYRGMGLGTQLLNSQKDLTKYLELDSLVLGARVPEYNKKKNIKPEDYVVLKRDDQELFDSELRFYNRAGLEILRIVSNYMEDDPESLNYGVIMIWNNEK